MSSNNKDRILCYTDGGFQSIPDLKCSYGVYMIPECIAKSREGIYKYGLIDYNKKTSQISEMWAIKVALETLIENEFNKFPVLIISDSQYCINTITKWYKGWVKKGECDSKQNIELWHKIMGMVRKFNNIKFQWVKGHTNASDLHSIHNEFVDGINQVAIGRKTFDKVWKKFNESN